MSGTVGFNGTPDQAAAFNAVRNQIMEQTENNGVGRAIANELMQGGAPADLAESLGTLWVDGEFDADTRNLVDLLTGGIDENGNVVPGGRAEGLEEMPLADNNVLPTLTEAQSDAELDKLVGKEFETAFTRQVDRIEGFHPGGEHYDGGIATMFAARLAEAHESYTSAEDFIAGVHAEMLEELNTEPTIDEKGNKHYDSYLLEKLDNTEKAALADIVANMPDLSDEQKSELTDAINKYSDETLFAEGEDPRMLGHEADNETRIEKVTDVHFEMNADTEGNFGARVTLPGPFQSADPLEAYQTNLGIQQNQDGDITGQADMRYIRRNESGSRERQGILSVNVGPSVNIDGHTGQVQISQDVIDTFNQRGTFEGPEITTKTTTLTPVNGLENGLDLNGDGTVDEGDVLPDRVTVDQSVVAGRGEVLEDPTLVGTRNDGDEEVTILNYESYSRVEDGIGLGASYLEGGNLSGNQLGGEGWNWYVEGGGRHVESLESDADGSALVVQGTLGHTWTDVLGVDQSALSLEGYANADYQLNSGDLNTGAGVRARASFSF